MKRSSNSESLFILFMGLVFFVPAVGAVWGWALNIVKLVEAVQAGPTAMLVLRAVGIFLMPVGAVLGYVN